MPAAILFGVLFTVAVSMALGSLLLGEACTDRGVRFVTGAALLSSLVFGLCTAGVVYPAVFAGLGAAALIPAVWKLRNEPNPTSKIEKQPVLFVLLAVFFVLYFLNSMAPEFSFDGSRYHLGLVGRYLREHGFHRITDSLYAGLSQGVEMLFLFAYAFGRHSAAAMVHFAFLVALTWLMFRYGQRIGLPLAGMVGAALVFLSPAVGVDASSAYNDVAVAAIVFGLFYLLELWDTDRSPRLLLAAGLLAGFGYAAKYTAWVAIPYALGYVWWRSRRLQNVLRVAMCAAVPSVPWAVKNWIWLRNPVAPFFNGLFPNPYLTVAFERDYTRHLAMYGLKSRWEIPLQVTVHGSLAGLLGPVFLLSPLALWALRRPEGRRLLLAAAVFGAGYFANISTRFLIPSLPFVALALAMVLTRMPRVAIAVVVVHAVLSWPDVLKRYAAPDAWRLAKVPYREALRIKPEDGFLQSNLVYYRETRMLDDATPPGSSVFTFTPIPEAYTSRRVLVSYQSAENIDRQRTFYTGFVPECAPTWQLRFRFARRELTAIRIVQGNSGPDLWNMHELRVFDGMLEWPRNHWRLGAKPDPWNLERLIDGRLTTFWVSGHTLAPGQYVEAGFELPAAADSVRIDTAPDQWGIGLRLEGRDTNGVWQLLAGQPELGDSPAPPNLRRAAAEELRRGGVDYLLLFDPEFGAADVREHAAEWGVRQVAQVREARLYQLP